MLQDGRWRKEGGVGEESEWRMEMNGRMEEESREGQGQGLGQLAGLGGV